MARPRIPKKDKRVDLNATVSPEAFAKLKRVAKTTGKARSYIVDKLIMEHKE